MSYDDFDFLFEEKELDPIIRDVAKAIWNKTYELFKDDFCESSITNIASDIIWCLSMEYNPTYGIFNLIDIEDSANKIRSFKDYCKDNEYKFNYKSPDFLADNIELICSSSKLSELLVFIRDILSKQDPRLNILQRDYYDYKNLPSSTGMSLESLPIAEYLYKYEKVKTIKTAVKESDGKSINWKLVPNDSEFWKEDIVLEDMIYVWSSVEKYSRFLDKDARWGFIDVVSKDRYYMPDNVDGIRDCRCGRAVFLDKKTGLYGYISPFGDVLIEPRFSVAMDFVKILGRCEAAVKLTTDEEHKMCYFDWDDYYGFGIDMGITIFNNLITIDTNGNFTPEIQKQYDEELKRFEQNYNNPKRGNDLGFDVRILPQTSYCESEDDIMRALEGGYGDMFGY